MSLLLKFMCRYRWMGIIGLTVVVSPATAQELASESQSAALTGMTSHDPADASGPAGGHQRNVEEPARELVTEKFVEEWLFYQADAAEKTVWSLRKEVSEVEPPQEDLLLICSGAVKGFAYTKEKHENFELSLEWRFPRDESGNSGVLVFAQAEPRIWPTSVQVQLHQPSAGALIASGDQKISEVHDGEPNLARPIGEWNDCRMTCVGGDVTVWINGKGAGRLKAVTPRGGSIALQSEGAEVHFRRIRLRPLGPSSSSKKNPADEPRR
ncbi:MAG: DUF1080 domain-containing protein [Planctomycetota bacterium]